MLILRSEVFPDIFSDKFSYKDKSMFIGSCFTENIGKKLLMLKYQALVNPFGIIYNPISVAQSLAQLLNPENFTSADLAYFNQKWISFSHHGRFSGKNLEEVLEYINNEMFNASFFLKDSKFLFITFGTSWVYKYKKNGNIVANCHKLPASEFEHYILSSETIVERYTLLLNELRTFNNKLKVVFTVSPVRHWKDGPVNNQLSKSTLLVAILSLIKKFDFASYFPAYEIMMDDLRDYRFYTDDLFHPNQTAIDYIWGKFRESFITEDAIKMSQEIDKILKAAAHKPFYPNTPDYQKFLDKNLSVIEQFVKKHPEIDFKDEVEYFTSEQKKYFID